jgi:HAD superfamily hydrolase (TIGR01509 family)
MTRAVVFDMDGVLISSEEVWDVVREDLARERGGRWGPQAHHDMMGMSTPEWTGYMHAEVGLPMSPAEIEREVVGRLIARYRSDLPLIDGAREAVIGMAGRLPLGLASSSSRALIDAVLGLAGLVGSFTVTVSSEEVGRGKPSPDVYLRALDGLGVAPADAVAVEDSAAGIRAASAAGMRVVAIPNALYPPAAEALALADDVLASIAELTPERVGA